MIWKGWSRKYGAEGGDARVGHAIMRSVLSTVLPHVGEQVAVARVAALEVGVERADVDRPARHAHGPEADARVGHALGVDDVHPPARFATRAFRPMPTATRATDPLPFTGIEVPRRTVR